MSAFPSFFFFLSPFLSPLGNQCCALFPGRKCLEPLNTSAWPSCSSHIGLGFSRTHLTPMLCLAVHH